MVSKGCSRTFQYEVPRLECSFTVNVIRLRFVDVTSRFIVPSGRLNSNGSSLARRETAVD
jgi:hypothetical protein